MARQGLGLARGLAHWRKGGACRTAAQPLPADAALVFQRGAPDLRGKSKIKLSQISWWKMGDKPAVLCLLIYCMACGIILCMRTTIDIPDVLYKAVRTRTAAEGTSLRYVTVALLGDWMQRPDWRPLARPEDIGVATERPKAKPRRRLACFGIAKPRKNIDGPHDMESIRESIAKRPRIR